MIFESAEDTPSPGYDRRFMTVKAAAEMAGVTPQAIHNWITRGYLDAEGQRVYLTEHKEAGRRYVILLHVLLAEAATASRGRGRTRKTLARVAA